MPTLTISPTGFIVHDLLCFDFRHCVFAAELAHEVLPTNTSNCFKEIGAQRRIEGSTFVMGDDYMPRK